MQVIRRFPALTTLSGRLRAVRHSALLPLSGLLLGLQCALPLAAEEAAVAIHPTVDHVASHVTEAARRFDIPEHWIRAVMQIESAGDSTAVSSAGAMGLMQIMPETWAVLRNRHGLGDDPFAPRDNILAGAAYLRAMLDRYGNTGAMLAAYNAGPGRYDEYLSGARELPAETRTYVATLAPILNDDVRLPQLAGGTPRIIDWRDAALFVAHSGSNRAQGTAPARHGEEADNASVPPHGPLQPVQSEALFVARSRVETAR